MLLLLFKPVLGCGVLHLALSQLQSTFKDDSLVRFPPGIRLEVTLLRSNSALCYIFTGLSVFKNE